MENITINDVNLGLALGMTFEEIMELDLHQSRILLQRKAFELRDNNETLSEEVADDLNKTLWQIQMELEQYGNYDGSIDYIVDFTSFVKGHKNYGSFCW